LGLVLAAALLAAATVAVAQTDEPKGTESSPQPDRHALRDRQGDRPDTPPPPEGGPPGENGSPRLGMRPGRIFGPLTDEEIESILAFTSKYLPELRQELDRLRQDNPTMFTEDMRRLRFEIRQLEALQKRDEKAFQTALEERRLRLHARDLAAKTRAATDEAERTRLRTELCDVLGKLFDTEMVTREAEIHRLEERIKEVRDSLKERAAHRSQTIDKRLEKMLSGKDLESESHGNPPGTSHVEAGGPEKTPPPPPPPAPSKKNTPSGQGGDAT
jgi:hypothetical protein